MTTRLVFFWLVISSFSQAELIPSVADQACAPSADMSLQRYRGMGGVIEAQGNAMAVESPVHAIDESCKDSTACEKRPLRKQLGEADLDEVITYSF